MSQLTEEQQERLGKLRERCQQAITAAIDNYEFRPLPRWGDIDFLLSLLDSDSQAAEWNYSKLAHDIISEYNTADDPGLLRSKVAEGLAQVASDAATAMRDKCVEKVREYLTDCRDEERGIIEAIAAELSSLTLDQVKPGEM